jgi:hypothetical protein
MAKPKVIIFDSPSHKVRRSCIAIASAYAQSELSKRSFLTDFFSVVDENVNRMFGLPLSTEAYKDVMDVPTEDFLGYCPAQIYEHMKQYLSNQYGKAFFGRVMARKLHRDNISDLYLVNGLCYIESILAVAYEVEPENVCIVYVDGPTTQERFTTPTPDNIRRFDLPQLDDYSMHKMCVEGCVKGFLEL